jgi:hypothetical protein
MPSYIAESWPPATRRGDLSSPATWARDAAEALAGDGHDVTNLRFAFTGSDVSASGSRVRAAPEPACGAQLRGPRSAFCSSAKDG